jgi:lysozyme
VVELVPDFSGNNETPAFLALRRAGVRVVGLKATEGLTWVDKTYAARRRRALLAGLRPLPYHFARPDLHPRQAQGEAEHFVGVVGRRRIRRFGLALDFETLCHDCGAAAMQAWARAFSQRVHQLTGEWPGFYANPSMIEWLRPGKPIGGWLWLADYGRNDGHQHGTVAPAPWRRVRLHQYTSRGRVPGARGDTDLSARFY